MLKILRIAQRFGLRRNYEGVVSIPEGVFNNDKI